MMISVSSSSTNKQELMALVRNKLSNQFATIEGVGDVFLTGFLDPNLRVWISGPALKRYELTVTDVMNAIKGEHVELPSGRIEMADREYNVRTMGEAESVREFGSILITGRGGQPNYVPLPLNQVARVEEGTEDVRRLSRAMGKTAVGLGIRKQRGSNAVAVARAVRARMDELRKQLPPGVEIGLNFDSTRFIENSVHELNTTLVLSALATAFVCWLFLGSISSTVNILLAIPTSIVGTFIVLYFAGFTLNTFTLLGLSLAIGIVVDDAIMVLENIIRYIEKGRDRVTAARTGAREITFAAMAATVAIIAIFLPVAFMRGVIGKFFFQFGVTMTVAVLLSLLEALTLTPMRCSQFVSAGDRNTRLGRLIEMAFQAAAGTYRRWLDRALDHRPLVIGGALLFFTVSLVAFLFLRKEFVPAQDQSSFMVRFQTPVGSSLALTDDRLRKAESYFASRGEVDRYFAFVGGGSGVNQAQAYVTLKPKGKRGRDPKTGKNLTQADIMNAFRKDLKKMAGVRVVIQDTSLRGFTASRGFPVEFAVQGPDWDRLAQYSRKVMDELEKTGMVTDLDTDYQEGMPEVRVIPDREAAYRHGVSVGTVAQTVNALVGGVIVGQYPKGGYRYDIRVRLEADERERSSQIRDLMVRNNRGELISLASLVRLEERPSLQSINRLNRQRSVSIFANVKQGQSQDKALATVEEVGRKVLPPGYGVVMSGSSQGFREAFSDLIMALILGIAVSYMVLASQFNSFIDPVTVLMALPFSVSGAFLALLGANQSLSIFSMIGLILLMGIVKKNSILLVDFTNNVADQGVHSVRKALLTACPIRFRPILMTSTATIAAALPPALGAGAGAETRIPMAVAVIGGVMVSTFLTLFVVPCVYSYFSRFDKRFREDRNGRNGNGRVPAASRALKTARTE